MQAQYSPLRDDLGSLRADLLTAESQSNALRAAAIQLLPDLAPVVAKWSTVQRAVILLSAPAPDASGQGATATVMEREKLGRAAADAMRAFGADLPALGQTLYSDLPALTRDPMLAHLQRTSAELAAQLRTAYTPQHLAGFAPRFRELTDLLDQYIVLRLRARQKEVRAALRKAQKEEGADLGAEAEAAKLGALEQEGDTLDQTADRLADASALEAHLAELREESPTATRPRSLLPGDRVRECGHARRAPVPGQEPPLGLLPVPCTVGIWRTENHLV